VRWGAAQEVSETGSSDMPEVHWRENKKSKKYDEHDPHGVCLKNAIGKRGWPQNPSEIATVEFSLQMPKMPNSANLWVILLMCAPMVAVFFFV